MLSKYASNDNNNNHGSFLWFFHVSHSIELDDTITTVPLFIKLFLWWVLLTSNTPFIQLLSLVEAYAKGRKHLLKQNKFGNNDSVVLCKLKTEQIYQIFRESLAFHFLAGSDAQSCRYLLTLFQNCGVLKMLVNTGRNFQLALINKAHRKSSHYHDKSTPTTFKVLLLLHSASVFIDIVRRMTLNISRSYATGTLIRYCVHFVTNGQ